MSLVQPQETVFRATSRDYLLHEYDAEFRHEWRDGVVTAKAGGTPPHSLVIANFIGTLHATLQGKPCRVYDSNLRVRAANSRLYTYPDLTVICGPPEFDPIDTRRQTVVNPKVMVEVLSPSSEGDDRGEKFGRYRDITSLEEYVLVSQNAPRVETFLRQPDGAWLYRAFDGLARTARLVSIGVEFPLADVFDGIEFPPASDPADERVL